MQVRSVALERVGDIAKDVASRSGPVAAEALVAGAGGAGRGRSSLGGAQRRGRRGICLDAVVVLLTATLPARTGAVSDATVFVVRLRDACLTPVPMLPPRAQLGKEAT